MTTYDVGNQGTGLGMAQNVTGLNSLMGSQLSEGPTVIHI